MQQKSLSCKILEGILGPSYSPLLLVNNYCQCARLQHYNRSKQNAYQEQVPDYNASQL